MIAAYTDAGHYKGHSFHSYVILKDEKVILRNCQVLNVVKTVDAEIKSIELLLESCLAKGIKEVQVHTDCRNIVDLVKSNNSKKAIRRIIELLDMTKSSIVWINRKRNTIAHKLCESMKRAVDSTIEAGKGSSIDPKKYVFINKERSPRVPHKIGWINKGNLNKKQMKTIIKYYNYLIPVDKRHSTDELFKWGEERATSNTYHGRLHFVERYISRFHTADEIRMDRATHVFDRYYKVNL